MLKDSKQIIWGILLLLAGLGVFFHVIPQKMREIEKIEHYASFLPFIRFCFIFMGVLLVGGGAKKIYQHYKNIEKKK